jgi:hypothetical protein
MNKQSFVIADLPHRNWSLKYLPDKFCAEDLKDKTHPFYYLLQDFDALRTITLFDVTTFKLIEPKIKQIGKIIDKMIDSHWRVTSLSTDVIVLTALTAYVATYNHLWFAKEFQSPDNLEPIENRPIVNLDKWLDRIGDKTYLEDRIKTCKSIYTLIYMKLIWKIIIHKFCYF